ncbi:MAG: DUF4290 domain-containing protein [Bacteroidales bacterium]
MQIITPMELEYNTTREKLINSEYGRNIQKLVERAMEIEDREKRTKFAKMIVQIMAQLNPGVRETGDFRHKLWDHLFIISNFKLDVDSPYEKPTPEKIFKKPEPLSYSDNKIRYGMYGANIERIIEKACELEDGWEKDALVHAIANHLKKSYLSWNRESVDDEQIFEHLEVLSKGRLKLKDEYRLSTTNEILQTTRKRKPAQSQQKPKQKKKRRR